MNESDGVIRAECPLYACRVCRTKTGWRHQPWCRMAENTAPDCADCQYLDRIRLLCAHPAQEKGEGAIHEAIPNTL